MSFRLISTIFAALAAASSGFSGSSGHSAPTRGGGSYLPSDRSLPTGAKLARAKTLLGLPVAPRSLTALLTLTVSAPALKDKGCLRFTGFNHVFPSYLDGGHASCPQGVASSGATISLDFMATQANKRHLVTYYLKSNLAQALRCDITGFPTQTIQTNGRTEPMVVFTPTKAGAQRIHLTAPKGMEFFAVDVDVLE